MLPPSSHTTGHTVPYHGGSCKTNEPAELMPAVLDRPNMLRAYARVRRNKGAAGVDGMVIGELSDHLKTHWPGHRQELLDGTYKPQPVRKVEIPKPGGR